MSDLKTSFLILSQLIHIIEPFIPCSVLGLFTTQGGDKCLVANEISMVGNSDIIYL